MCSDDDVITNKDLAWGVEVFFFSHFFKMSYKAFPNGCIQKYKNLFSIRLITESSIFEKPLTSVYFKNDQLRDCIYFCPHIENVVNLDADVRRGFTLSVFQLMKF